MGDELELMAGAPEQSRCYPTPEEMGVELPVVSPATLLALPSSRVNEIKARLERTRDQLAVSSGARVDAAKYFHDFQSLLQAVGVLVCEDQNSSVAAMTYVRDIGDLLRSVEALAGARVSL